MAQITMTTLEKYKKWKMENEEEIEKLEDKKIEIKRELRQRRYNKKEIEKWIKEEEEKENNRDQLRKSINRDQKS